MALYLNKCHKTVPIYKNKCHNVHLYTSRQNLKEMMQDFIKNSKGLTRNPLGIIALFISLIYGFACLVLSTSLSNLIGITERLPLIWFIIGFPVLILISFILMVIFLNGIQAE